MAPRSGTTTRASLMDGIEVRPDPSGRGAPAPRPAGPARKRVMLKVGLSALFLLVALILIIRSFTGKEPGAETRTRPVVDAMTGEVFEHYHVADGQMYPYKNPKTGDNTLYPAEPCYWTRDGKAKLIPSYVYVKAYAGEPGRTTCPDCGHEVRQHNPMPPDELMLQALEESKK